jgi:hypothetical protein
MLEAEVNIAPTTHTHRRSASRRHDACDAPVPSATSVSLSSKRPETDTRRIAVYAHSLIGGIMLEKAKVSLAVPLMSIDSA